MGRPAKRQRISDPFPPRASYSHQNSDVYYHEPDHRNRPLEVKSGQYGKNQELYDEDIEYLDESSAEPVEEEIDEDIQNIEDDAEEESDGDYEDDEDDIEEDIPPGPDADLQAKRAQVDNKLKSTFEAIFEKYGKDFTDVGDEIDLRTGEVIVNNGHLAKMKDETDAGHARTERSMLRAFTQEPDNRMTGGSEEDDEEDYLEKSFEQNFSNLRDGRRMLRAFTMEPENQPRPSIEHDDDDLAKEKQSSGDEDEDDDAILYGGTVIAKYKPSPPRLEHQFKRPEMPKARSSEKVLPKPISREEKTAYPSEPDILAQFGSKLGPRIAEYVSQQRIVDDSKIEPAWRAPKISAITPGKRPILKSILLQPEEIRSPSPNSSTSLWAPPRPRGRRRKENSHLSQMSSGQTVVRDTTTFTRDIITTSTISSTTRRRHSERIKTLSMDNSHNLNIPVEDPRKAFPSESIVDDARSESLEPRRKLKNPQKLKANRLDENSRDANHVSGTGSSSKYYSPEDDAALLEWVAWVVGHTDMTIWGLDHWKLLAVRNPRHPFLSWLDRYRKVYWKERKAHPDIVIKEMNAIRSRSNWTIDDAPVFHYAVRNEQSGVSVSEKGNTMSLNSKDRQMGGFNSTQQEKHESRSLDGDAGITRRRRGRPRKNLANVPVPTPIDGRVKDMALSRRQDASDGQGMDSRSNPECPNSIERLPELRNGPSGSGHSPTAYQYPSVARSPQISRTIPNSQESPGDSSSSPAVQLFKQQKSKAAAASLLEQFQRNSVPQSYIFSDDDEDVSPVLNGRPNFNQAEDSHAILGETALDGSFDIPIDPALLDPSLLDPELLESPIVGQIPCDSIVTEPSSSTGHGGSRVVSDEPLQDFNLSFVNLAESTEIKSKEADAVFITGPAQSNEASPPEHISPLPRPVSSPLKPQPLNKALRTPVANMFDSSKRYTTPTLKRKSPPADDPETDDLIMASEDIMILSAQKASQQGPQSPTPKPKRTPGLHDKLSVSRPMAAPRHSFSPSSGRGNFGEQKKNLVETPSRNVRSSKSSLGSPYFKTPGGTMRKCGESGFRCERGFCFKCSAAVD